ncbi:MAG: 4-(cytidine 5'-diphospho)-2-C-methyl-D-erythritol kinase [Candidatus Nanopelagicales bacterium]|nr:4-(cytidine 5'-diphospho)-2-C-methyl-D-erythritol kinase [Candidatus Nanopelagicales bacterium]MDZ4249577.1 4-(cytidine 5'-diphospho)-2-C-methyl-D-erythritol kinase [Candidatus Nanopelagicales bacterium]
MPKTVRVRVPAKINLALSVGGLRPDGYHEIATVYQALSLFDHVTISQVKPGSGITLTVAGESVEAVPTNESNLAWRAAQLAGETFGFPLDLDIHLDKRIPVAGGMAGGSADAAGTLLACITAWDVTVSRDELQALAARLGSDVPFPLLGGTAVGTGRGEILTSAMSSGQFHWVLALSHLGLSAPEVYRAYDELGPPANRRPSVDASVLLAVRSDDARALGRALSNDLQAAAVGLLPHLRLLLDLGMEHGALGALVSGSGPTCGFLVADEEAAMELAIALSSSGLCRSVRRATGPAPGASVV